MTEVDTASGTGSATQAVGTRPEAEEYVFHS